MTLTLLSQNNIKKAMEKLKQSSMFMNTEDRQLYIDNLSEEDLNNLQTIVKVINDCDDNTKSSLLTEVLKELGLKTLSLNMLEELIMIKDETIDIQKERIESLEKEKLEQSNNKEQYEKNIRERKERESNDLERLGTKIQLIKRNKDPKLRNKMLSKAINNNC